MSTRRLSQRSILSVSNRVNSANVKTILSVPQRLYAEYLVVGGGGAGGAYGAGGGGGGYLTSNLNIIAGKTYVITVGAGGGYSMSPRVGFSGSNSSIITTISPSANVISYGGGGGGGSGDTAGGNGGSGGGGGQGYPGGLGITDTELLIVGVVCVTGAKGLQDVAVVLAALVGVLNQQRNRGAGGLTFVHTRQDLHLVGFVALRHMAAGTGAATV